MQRYLETLFRRKALFLFPAIVIPVLAAAVAFYVGREYVIRASVWAQNTQILADGSGTRRAANDIEAQAINDRLRTVAFSSQVMDRAGLTDVILNGEWPQPTRLQSQLSGIPLVEGLAKRLGLMPPDSLNGALVVGLNTVRDGVTATTAGDNLVLITYIGADPALGQRLVEETINLHREEVVASRIREGDAGIEYLTRQLKTQEEKFIASSEALARFDAEFPPPPAGLSRPPEELQERQSLQKEGVLDEAQYISALNRLEDLRLRSDASISTAGLRFRVVDLPSAPSAGASINPRTIAVMGLLGITLGGIIGVTAIVIATWRDGTVRSRADIERTIHTTLIVEVPQRASKSARPKGSSNPASELLARLRGGDRGVVQS